MVKQKELVWRRIKGEDHKAFPTLCIITGGLLAFLFGIIFIIQLLSPTTTKAFYSFIIVSLSLIVFIYGQRAQDYAYQVQNNGRKYDWINVEKENSYDVYKQSKDKPKED